MKTVYMDNAATTKVREEVLESMLDFYKDGYGNPSSVYKIGREAKSAIEAAREQVAKALNANPKEIYFTGSGTEADNWAIKGIAEAYADKGNHIITSKIEHHAVLHTCEYLETKGFEVTYVDVDEFGVINLEQLKNAIRPTTILITVMFANNEIGTIQPIKEIGDIAKENKIIFHTDAVQAMGHVNIDVKELNIDLLSLSGHKLHGPKGVGALYVRTGLKLKNLLHGGGQERKRRAGTENVAGIVALGKAVELAMEELEAEATRLTALRDKLILGLMQSNEHTFLNGHPVDRLPGNVNISFLFIEGESLLLRLDMAGIYCSSGSACTSGSLDPSHVLLSIGLKHEEAHGSLRLSLGKYTTEEEVDYVIEQVKPVVDLLRRMSPLYEDFLNSNK